MVDVNDEVFTEEDFYLCKMFGEDCRFVEVSGGGAEGEIVKLQSSSSCIFFWTFTGMEKVGINSY